MFDKNRLWCLKMPLAPASFGSCLSLERPHARRIGWSRLLLETFRNEKYEKTFRSTDLQSNPQKPQRIIYNICRTWFDQLHLYLHMSKSVGLFSVSLTKPCFLKRAESPRQKKKTFQWNQFKTSERKDGKTKIFRFLRFFFRFYISEFSKWQNSTVSITEARSLSADSLTKLPFGQRQVTVIDPDIWGKM